MKINIKNLTNLITRVTVNHTIEYCHLVFSDSRITSSVRNQNGDIIVDFNVPDDVFFGGLGEQELVMDLMDPKVRVLPPLKPFLNNTQVDLEIEEDKLIFKNGKRKVKLFLSDPSVLQDLIFRREETDIEYFCEMHVDDDFKGYYKELKRDANRYNKYYFTVKNGHFHIETTDKTDLFADSIQYELGNLNGVDDLTMCFDKRKFDALMDTIGDCPYSMWFTWTEEADRCMIYAFSEDDTEKVYLFSREI